jgi:hypothetical protein
MSRLALAGAVLFAACAHAPGRAPRPGVVTTAEGWAPVAKGDPAGTRRRALTDALRAAVEQASGARIAAKTSVAQAVTVEDSITARVSGEVRSYEILGESEQDGFHRTRVRVLVDVGAPPSDGDRPGPPPGNPTVAVELAGPHATEAAAAVKKGLIERGFAVVEKRADLTVSGEVSVRPNGGIGPWLSSRARVTLSARQNKTARILWTSSREAGGVGSVMAAADIKASEAAGLLGGEELAKEVAVRLAE